MNVLVKNNPPNKSLFLFHDSILCSGPHMKRIQNIPGLVDFPLTNELVKMIMLI